jgi:hypothetical protein
MMERQSMNKPRLYMIALWFGLLLLFAAWALGWLR